MEGIFLNIHKNKNTCRQNQEISMDGVTIYSENHTHVYLIIIIYIPFRITFCIQIKYSRLDNSSKEINKI